MDTYGPFEIQSGITDQYVYFEAPSGLSGHTVERSRNTTSFTSMTTPTVTELGSTGVYALLLDEDMTIGASNDVEQMFFVVSAVGMQDVGIFVQLRRPVVTAGETIAVTSGAVDTVTTNTDLVTAASVRAEVDSNSTQLSAIVADTNELQTDDVPGLIAALNDLSAAEVNTECDTALTDYDPPTKAEVDALLTTALTESYAADGAAPTLTQALFQIMQFLHEAAVTSTTVSVKKLDGSTEAMTFTINDADEPTSITRAS